MASNFEHFIQETTADSRIGEAVAPDGVAYNLVVERLREAFYRTHKEKGVDSVIAVECEQDVRGNQQRLLD